MNFLPSQRFSLIVIAILIAGGVVYAVLPEEPTPVSLNTLALQSTASPGNLVPVENPVLRQAAEVDTDGDGLPDWEEKLWKTDITKKDTDGDGTTDAAEIDAGRNPTIKGPKDSIKETVSLEASYLKDAEAAEQDLSATDKVAREFFVKYLSLKQQSASLTARDSQQLLTDTMKLAAEKAPAPKTYTTNEFTISAQNTPESLRLYANILGDNIRKNSVSDENELTLFAEATQNANLGTLVEIENIAKTYDAMITDMLTMSVPSSMISAHTFLINRVSAIAETVHGLAEYETDPVLSLVAFTNYEERAAGLALGIQGVQNLLIEAGIIFEKNEPGYMLMQTRAVL